MGLTAAHLGDHERAASAFRLVAEATDCRRPGADLVAEELLLGHDVAARDAVGRASRLGLQRPGVAMAIGDLAARAGDIALSDRAFMEAIRLVPSLAGDPWWQADARRSAQLARLVDALTQASASGEPWQVALMAGDADRAQPAAGGPSRRGDDRAERLTDAWSGDVAASTGSSTSPMRIRSTSPRPGQPGSRRRGITDSQPLPAVGLQPLVSMAALHRRCGCPITSSWAARFGATWRTSGAPPPTGGPLRSTRGCPRLSSSSSSRPPVPLRGRTTRE
jgi:hypothetical protein